MDSSAQNSDLRQTEFRLLKPMPSRQAPEDGHGAAALLDQPWDTQIRRLFPPRDIPAASLPTVAGIQLGHFEIDERIARGGMGTVFRGRDLRLDRVVALKVLSQEQLRDPAAVQRFQNEARAAAKLDHENIARVYFVGEDRGVHFIAFEYVRGTTVREAIASKGLLSQDEAVNYTLQAAEALRHTDMAGVVHRDIKPSNLIVTPSGRVKLVDLGLARQVNPTEDLDLTVTGTTLGTFDYISPEQARDPRNVDVRSDIYSLGCTLYQMLTGSPPYPQGGSVDKLLQHNAGRPPDPCELNPRISPRLALVVQRMMASNPDERYPSPQALIDELVDLAAGLGLRATAPEGTIWRKPLYRTGSPWWEEHRGWVLAFGTILLLALLGNNIQQWVIALNNRNHDPEDAGRLASGDDASTAIDRVPLVDPGTSFGPEAAAPRIEIPSPPRDAVVTTPQTVSGIPQAGVVAANAGASETAFAPRIPAVPTTQPTESNPGTNATSIAVGPNLQQVAQTAIAIATKSGIAPVESGSESAMQPTTASGTLPVGIGEATPPRTAASGVAALESSVFVVLGADGTTIGRYQSLEAACHVAKSGAVIEIAHDGPVRAPQKPVFIQGKRLTIRPAPGMRPLLKFAPGDVSRADKSLRMIDVVDGSIEVYDLDLAMEVTNSVFADEWVLLSTNRPREIALRGVTLTVENSGWRPAVMIERRMTVNTPSVMMPQPEPMRDADLQIRDCLFRGNATFYVDRTLEPASIRISETAIGVDGDALRVEGADQADMDSPARASGPIVRMELEHVTIATRRSALRLWSESVRDLPDVRIDCRNSILDGSVAESPLFLLEGHQDADVLLQHLHWSGGRNVLVTSEDRQCVVRGMWPQVEEWPYAFGQWQAQSQPDWELASEAVTTLRVLTWEPGDGASLSAMQTSDFALRPMESAETPNPAYASASDSSHRGFRPAYSHLPSTLP